MPVTRHGVLAVGGKDLNPDVVRAASRWARRPAATLSEEPCRIRASEPQPRDRAAQRFGFDRELRTRLVAINGMKPSPDPAQP
jgi:hypothetical protein